MTKERAFTVNITDRIATVLFDLPGRTVNILTPAVLEELDRILDDITGKSPDLDGAVILSGKESTFIAGADISLLEGLTDPGEGTRLARRGQEVYRKLERLPIPVVAAIHGACLGGGLELALACTWRVASDDEKTVLALPEVQLGIIPGFGGTQRLPKIVGTAEALRLITAGSRVFANKARRIGLVDELVPRENLVKAAKRIIRRYGNRRKRTTLTEAFRRPQNFFLDKSTPGRTYVLGKARENVRSVTRGQYPAPLAAIDAVEEGLRHGVERGFETEARLIGNLAVTEVSKNLIRMFRLRERYSHIEGEPAAYVTRMGVVGAGVMGAGITTLGAEKGLWMRLINGSPKRLGNAVRQVHETVEKKRKRGMYSAEAAAWVPQRVTYDTKIRGLGGVQVVIEAVAERTDVKKSVLADIARATRGDAIIASNTSSLSISVLQKDIAIPERVAGMHFFNPVDKMPLVEIVRGDRTSAETTRILAALAARLGKIPVVVKDRPGFLVNRILMAYLNEAARLLEEGVPMEAIDVALRDFGMPMGAFRLLDTVGIDIAVDAADNLHKGFGERMKASPVVKALLEAGRTGRKTGRGFYRYDRQGHHATDHETLKILKGIAAPPRAMAPDEIVKRSIHAMINEAAWCLEESVVERAEEVDIGMLLGAGFPPWTGGLLWYADSIGAEQILIDLETFRETVGARFAPAHLLRVLAREGTGFHAAASGEREEVTA